MSMLMPILDVIDPEMFSESSDLIIDPISYLGTSPDVCKCKTNCAKVASTYAKLRKSLRDLVQKIEHDNSIDHDHDHEEENEMDNEKLVLEMASMGNLVCGLPTHLVDWLVGQISQRKEMLHLLGSTVQMCRNEEILKIVAKKVPLSVIMYVVRIDILYVHWDHNFT